MSALSDLHVSDLYYKHKSSINWRLNPPLPNRTGSTCLLSCSEFFWCWAAQNPMVSEGSKACRGTLHPLLPAEAVDRQELRMQLGPPHVHLQQRGRVFEKRPERRPFVVKLLIAKKLEPTPPHPLPRGRTSLGLAGCLQPTALTQTPTQRQDSTKKRVSLQGCHPLRATLFGALQAPAGG